MTARIRALHARAWDAADFEPLARATSAIHDVVVARLGVRAGERWLDLATGTGPVALRAAAGGAVVTGVDISPRMLRTARRRAQEEGAVVRFVLADAESLPFPDRTFDVVSSTQGVMFALDHRRAARELARVSVPGARLALTALTPVWENAELFSLWRRLVPLAVDGGDPLAWGRRDYVEQLLGAAFELEFVDGDAPLLGGSAKDLWQLQATSCGPVSLLERSLPPAERARLRSEVTAYYERFATQGGVRAPRPYLLVLGRRRAS